MQYMVKDGRTYNGQALLSGNTVIQHLDSIAELDSLAVPNRHLGSFAKVVTERRKGPHESERWWGYGVHSGNWEKVREFIAHGHPQARLRGHKFVDRLDFPPTQMRTVRRVRRRGDYGDDVDMQRVWSGDLDRAWEYTAREGGAMAMKNNNVIVAIDTAILASQDSDDLFWNVATGISVVDALCRSGRNVEVLAVSECEPIYRGDTTNWLTSITLKKATHPLNLDVLFATTLGGFHRGYMWKTRHLQPSHRPPDGMGRSIHCNTRSPFWPATWPVVYISGCTNEAIAKSKIETLVKRFDENDLAIDRFN